MRTVHDLARIPTSLDRAIGVAWLGGWVGLTRCENGEGTNHKQESRIVASTD